MRYFINLFFTSFFTINILLLFPISCSASIPPDEVALGGISYGSSVDYVREIYGSPERNIVNEKSPLFTGYLNRYYYGNSFSILFRNGSALRLETTAKNGIKTPSGISVGSDESLVIDAYGDCDEKRTAIYGKVVSRYYHIDDNKNIGLKFNFDSKGIVTSIYAGQFD